MEQELAESSREGYSNPVSPKLYKPERDISLLTKIPLSALYRSCTVSLYPGQTAIPTCGLFRLLSKYKHVFD